ncbi:putative PurR-regulated permease PerM [Bradyrhizobium japonicum]|uniref:AI-2E family transporter n=1 Tax=Bradyrhizobium TaxID=374 RepID=UPI001FDA9779|nr:MULTISPECIES: AI-2E family transporter [Bradyrhizobium]MCP1743984.1 putative PurR-regulated permease PerM [Bradyrhizobium japonicum]MCP1861699.1 putative PurR-regulated permease PerM [Bradyrhizobium japonicum]MCP1892458.1 putative PurR-regulated permease PerM [Bradyrhizobium japonicum]MCW2325582.1 putative PurR-regulated permease PerM [Bradyrhizobium japonicum]WLC00327.1 AI-2E family transporter [Bradyrhizobium japonicum USDA 123]
MIIVSALYVGREIFVPVALAILLSFALASPVSALQRLKVPRGIAVVGVVLFAFAIIFALGSLIAAQLNRLAGDLPSYQVTIQSKIQSVRGITGGSSTLERAAGMLQDLGKELDKPKGAVPEKSVSPSLGSPLGSRPVAPVPVEVLQPDPGALESLRSLIAPLISPLATTGIIVIFVIFILIQREDLRNRLIRLAGSHDLQRTTAALDDAGNRLSRLFLNQLLINTGFGILIGAGLWLIGIPSAVLWGILAAVLRFVPYIGSIIAAAFPLALAVAVQPGWSMLVWTAALFFVVEPAVGQIVEPMVYGRSTGLSPVAVVVSATFWTALWGPIGLVLATPLTVCLVVLGRHVERLAFLDVMFGDRPALSPAEIFYQRMLAGDPTEATEKAEEYLKERSLSSYYDEVAIKGLLLAQSDLERDVLDHSRLVKIRDTVVEFAEDLSEQTDQEPRGEHSTIDAEAAAAVEAAAAEPIYPDLPILKRSDLPVEWQGDYPVLCIAGRTALDEAAGIMFAQLCNVHGLQTRIEGPDALSTSNILRLQTEGVSMVCLSYLNASNPAQVRYAVRRLRRKLPRASILVGLWSGTGDSQRAVSVKESSKADVLASTLREATRVCIEAARPDLAVLEDVSVKRGTNNTAS